MFAPIRHGERATYFRLRRSCCGIPDLHGLGTSVDRRHLGVDAQVEVEAPTERLWLGDEQAAALRDNTTDVILKVVQAARYECVQTVRYKCMGTPRGKLAHVHVRTIFAKLQS